MSASGVLIFENESGTGFVHVPASQAREYLLSFAKISSCTKIAKIASHIIYFAIVSVTCCLTRFEQRRLGAYDSASRVRRGSNIDDFLVAEDEQYERELIAFQLEETRLRRAIAALAAERHFMISFADSHLHCTAVESPPTSPRAAAAAAKASAFSSVSTTFALLDSVTGVPRETGTTAPSELEQQTVQMLEALSN